MARISYVEPANAGPEVKEIYDQVFKGKPMNVHQAMAHRPRDLKNFITFYASVGRGLPHKLYDLVYLRVSMINGCHYCTQHHIASGKKVGIGPEDVKALRTDETHARFTEQERAALSFAEKLTRTPGHITDADIAKLKKHFSEAEIVDLDLLIGLVNLTNRFTDPLGLELEWKAESI